MTEEIITKEYNGGVNTSPMVGQFDEVNQGTIAVESSRAIAEAQGKLIIAKRFPRDEVKSMSRILESCQRPDFASKAFYSYPRSERTVEGVTIRFAEEIARCWGNLDYGIKEMSQNEGKSEMMAYCWDMETNTISQQNFTNVHAREKGKSVVQLTSLRDIYEVNANMGARRLRSRILAIVPNYVVKRAVAECKKTLAGDNEQPLIDRINNMVSQFKKIGVTVELLESRLGRPIATMTRDDFVEYIGIFNSIKEKERDIADWFNYGELETPKSDLGDLLGE